MKMILNTHPTMMGLGFLNAHPTTHVKTLYIQSDNVKITLKLTTFYSKPEYYKGSFPSMLGGSILCMRIVGFDSSPRLRELTLFFFLKIRFTTID
jgi:hypothetical protein